jgi:hypothetical protein
MTKLSNHFGEFIVDPQTGDVTPTKLIICGNDHPH